MEFVLLCNGGVSKEWQCRSIKQLVDHGHSCKLIISNEGNHTSRKPGFLYRAFTRFRLKTELIQNRSISELAELRDAVFIETKPERVKGRDVLSDETLDRIRQAKPDFILRFGFNILTGELLTIAKYGVWSFHHGDELRYRGGPPGFWEVYKGDHTSGLILQRLTEKLDGGIILRKGILQTVRNSYSHNLHQLLLAGINWPAQLADQYEKSPESETSAPSATKAPITTYPTNAQLLVYLLKAPFRSLEQYRKRYFRSEAWRVGTARKTAGEYAIPAEITWEGSGLKYFKADPFPFENGMLFEYFDRRTGKGSILNKAGQTILAGNHHFSYPFVWNENGVLWIIPEQSEAGTTVAYQMHDGEIVDQIQLLDIGLVDPTLVRKDGRLWLFGCDPAFPNAALLLFSADSLSGPWEAHPQNPVKFDVTGSRPGGTPFWDGGNLIRPAQDNAQHYGRRIRLFRITEMSETDYREEEFGTIEPPDGFVGIHTYSITDDTVIFDAKKHTLNPYHTRFRLYQKFRGK